LSAGRRLSASGGIHHFPPANLSLTAATPQRFQFCVAPHSELTTRTADHFVDKRKNLAKEFLRSII
jgi:hypothetical protein